MRRVLIITSFGYKQIDAATAAGRFQNNSTALILVLGGDALDIRHTISESEQQSYSFLMNI